MKINVSHESLKPVVEKIEKEMEFVANEREELGLSDTQDFDVDINTGLDRRGYLGRTLLGPPKIIELYGIEYAIGDLYRKDENLRKGINDLQFYFSSVEDLLYVAGNKKSKVREKDIISFICDPESAIRKIESENAGIANDIYWEMVGVDYEKMKHYLISESGVSMDALEIITPAVAEAFMKAKTLKRLRHEKDHTDFFSGPIYTELNDAMNGMDAARFAFSKGDMSEKDFIKANKRIIKAHKEGETIYEPRGMFFNYVKPGEWTKENIENAKSLVKCFFGMNGYTAFTTEYFLDWMLNSIPSDVVNNNTKDYTRQYFGSGLKAEKIVKKSHDDPVDHKFVNRFIYKDLPNAMYRFSEMARNATDVIGDAYKVNPSLLSTANSAKSYKEYLNICKAGL